MFLRVLQQLLMFLSLVVVLIFSLSTKPTDRIVVYKNCYLVPCLVIIALERKQHYIFQVQSPLDPLP